MQLVKMGDSGRFLRAAGYWSVSVAGAAALSSCATV